MFLTITLSIKRSYVEQTEQKFERRPFIISQCNLKQHTSLDAINNVLCIRYFYVLLKWHTSIRVITCYDTCEHSFCFSFQTNSFMVADYKLAFAFRYVKLNEMIYILVHSLFNLYNIFNFLTVMNNKLISNRLWALNTLR